MTPQGDAKNEDTGGGHTMIKALKVIVALTVSWVIAVVASEVLYEWTRNEEELVLFCALPPVVALVISGLFRWAFGPAIFSIDKRNLTLVAIFLTALVGANFAIEAADSAEYAYGRIDDLESQISSAASSAADAEQAAEEASMNCSR
jgi:hypothetical protein